jgi:hypothetical protein
MLLVMSDNENIEQVNGCMAHQSAAQELSILEFPELLLATKCDAVSTDGSAIKPWVRLVIVCVVMAEKNDFWVSSLTTLTSM